MERNTRTNLRSETEIQASAKVFAHYLHRIRPHRRLAPQAAFVHYAHSYHLWQQYGASLSED